MKIFTVIILSFVLSLKFSIEANDEGANLFILSGQSNMNGLKTQVSFTPAVEKAFGKSSVIVVKDAQNGQSIRRWYKQWKPAKGTKLKHNRSNEVGDLYDRLIKKVMTVTEGKKISSVTFIWMQGESDAGKQCAVYEVSFKGVIDQLKKDLEIDTLNIVIGRISDYGLIKKNKYWSIIRDIQVKMAEDLPNAAWVDTDDLNDISKNGSVRHDLHYTKEGYKILGQRFAEKAIGLIKKNGSEK